MGKAHCRERTQHVTLQDSNSPPPSRKHMQKLNSQSPCAKSRTYLNLSATRKKTNYIPPKTRTNFKNLLALTRRTSMKIPTGENIFVIYSQVLFDTHLGIIYHKMEILQ